MPQENGWATGTEHCTNNGRTCPYCGSENTNTGSTEMQPGQVVEGGCTCLDCERSWSNLYNIAGWYSGEFEDELHEDLEQHDKAEKADVLEKERDHFRDTLIGLRKNIWAKDIPSPTCPEYVEWHRNCKSWLDLIDKTFEAIKPEE